MRIVPDYKNMKLKDYPTIEEIMDEMSKKEPRPDYVMTPEEMLEMADQMEARTYKGHINLAMSWNETIDALRKEAYEILENN